MSTQPTDSQASASPSLRKPYPQPQPRNWWQHNRFFRFYMLREATSVPIFLYALLLIWGLYQLGSGETAFNDWLTWMASPLMQLFHLLVIAAALLHAYTWFDLTPKILVVRLGDYRVPDQWVKLAHYGGFIVTSAALLWLAFQFIKGA